MLKQHYEMVGKLHRIKEIQTKTGKWMYSFSIPIVKMVGEEQHTQWLQATIILKERDPRLINHKGEFHFTGALVLKEAWNNYPESLSFLGFEITPVLGNVYRITKPKAPPAVEVEGHNIANGMNSPSEMQRQKFEKEQNYVDPVAKLNPASPEIPM